MAAGRDGLLITAGAGMGVDSGLPSAALKASGARIRRCEHRASRFEEIASPETFRRGPTLAWAFYGHRLNLYRRTDSHRRFNILRTWPATKSHGAFVFTSNVDRQFQNAGFADERIAECHGSIH